MFLQSPYFQPRSPPVTGAKVRLSSLSFHWGPQRPKQNNRWQGLSPPPAACPTPEGGPDGMGPSSPRVGQSCGTDPCGASPSLRAQWEASGESPRPRGPGQCWSQAWEKSRSARGLAVLAARRGLQQHCPGPAAGRGGEPAWSRPKGTLQGRAPGGGWAPTRTEGQELSL